MSEGTGVPRLCECHHKEMYVATRRSGPSAGLLHFQCAVKAKESQRKTYWHQSGVEYSRLLLEHRRHKALQRKAQREQEAN